MEISLQNLYVDVGLKSLGYDIKVPDETNSYLLCNKKSARRACPCSNESLNLELGPIWIDGNCTDTLRAVVSQGRTLRYERRETIASSRLIL